MNKRMPVFVLGGLVLLAIIARIVSPPAPVPPGPLGAMPNWSSHVKFGDLGPNTVNPEGTMWAGAWNASTKSGKLRSAIWIIDFNTQKARTCTLKDGVYVYGLTWATDGKTIQVAAAPTNKPLANKKWQSITVNPDEAKVVSGEPVTINDKILRILNWPSSEDSYMIARTGGKKLTLAIASAKDGNIVGNEVVTDLPKDASLYGMTAMNPDGSSFVFSVTDAISSNINYYLADTKTGTSKQIFTLRDLPGKVDNLWISQSGVLILCSAREKYELYAYSPTAGKLQKAKEAGLDIASSWPNAPKHILLTALIGCYDYDMAKCKAKKIIDLSKFDRREEAWHMSVRSGQLYPRKDGNFTSVSVVEDMPDIRIINKDGTKGDDLLPR